MNDVDVPAVSAGQNEVVPADDVVEAAAVAENTAEGEQPEAPPPDAEDERRKRENRERREREKAFKERLRTERQAAEMKAREAEDRLARLKEAGQRAAPPQEADFPDPLEYAAAKAIWRDRQSQRDEEAREAQRQAEEARKVAEGIGAREQQIELAAWEEQVSRARQRYQDFDAVIRSDALPVSRETARLLAGSPVGADVAYYLGQNIELAAEIYRMTPLEQARAIGRLEATVAAPKPRTETSAPPPIAPVRPAGGATKNPANMTPDEYRAWREAGGTIR